MTTYSRAVLAPPRASTRSRGTKAQPRIYASQGAAAPSWKIVGGLCLLLAALTIGVYSRVGSHPFLQYDDQSYVTENDHVKEGLSWDTVNWALTSVNASNWHPVTWLSHALDCELFGLRPSGHHWMNVVLHVADVVLLFLILLRVTGALRASLFVAALFAMHPLNVETVAWVAERKSVLSTLFFFLSIGAYGWYARKPSVGRYVLVAVLFALGLASKPMVITLPFVLLLLDFWPLQRVKGWIEPSATFPVQQESWSRLLVEKVPLLALSAASAAITLFAQTPAEVLTGILPFSVRLQNSLYAYCVYIWQMFWPAHLALMYPHPGRQLAWWKPLLGILVLLAGSLIACGQRKKRPYIAVGWCWYLGTAVPIIGLVQVGGQATADRYAYIPLIGLFAIVAWGLFSAGYYAQARFTWRDVVALVALGALSFVTWRQLDYWRSTTEVWAHAVEVTENNGPAQSFLANALFADGRYQEALAHLKEYGRLAPLDAGAHARLGAILQDQGQLSDAIAEYDNSIHAQQVLSKYGAQPGASSMLALDFANMGVIYAQLGEESKARQLFRKGLDTDEDAIVQTITQLAKVVMANPTAKGYLHLGTLLELADQHAQAREAFARAQEIDPAAAPPAALSSSLNTP